MDNNHKDAHVGEVVLSAAEARRLGVSAGGNGGEVKTIGEWQRAKQVPAWKHNAAVALLGWTPNHEVNEGDYDQAIEDAANVRIG
jgi:hypothetical protein